MSKDTYSIAVLPGDGIGPEVVSAAIDVLDAAAESTGVSFDYTTLEAGADYYRRHGESISDESMRTVGEADAVLLGAMGLPDVRHPDGTEINPQIEIREHFGLFASLRPARLLPGVPTNVRSTDVDMLVIRETTEGLFAGRLDPVEPSDESMSDRLTITRATSERLFTLAFEQAQTRRSAAGTPGKVTLLDKANVLRSNAFMQKVFLEVAERFPSIDHDHLYIDAGSMMMVTNPERFDVVVTENVFGDIVSEIAAGVIGGLGVAPSGDVSLERGVFQPCHGTATDIAGLGLANPVATVESVAMMVEWLASQHDDARLITIAAAIRRSTALALADGATTPDLGGTLTTEEAVGRITESISRPVDA